ncbi:MAG TPA: hypothetical protein VLM79_00185 [Kofleriaceae bacterium]|nr:hypothetical protein [Kofleriaceae bacterium]
MSDSDRDPDDEDWLLARERGDDISHVSPQARARYDQLDQLIAALPDRPPPAGWKQRVLDALDAPTPRGSSDALEALPRSPPTSTAAAARGSRTPIVRGWRAWILAAGGAVAGILILQLVIPRAKQAPAEPIVTTEVRRGEIVHRGDDASVGDTLVVHAQADQPIELRVYGDGGEPMARCTDTQGCTIERGGAERRYTLEVPLPARGDVLTVLFSGGAMTEPRKDLEADLAAARNARIDARQVAVVHVR